MHYVKGDILKHVSTGIIVQGVNLQGVMGSGVAKVIRAKYPDVYKNYMLDIAYHGKLGFVSWCWLYVGQSETRELAIASAFTQEFYGNDNCRYIDYEAIYVCLDEIFSVAKKESMKVSMPKICAGLGGGDWSIIEAIIKSTAKKNNYLEDLITVYEL